MDLSGFLGADPFIIVPKRNPSSPQFRLHCPKSSGRPMALRAALSTATSALFRSSPASKLVPRRGFSAGADHHGPQKVNIWDDPLSPSKWKDEHKPRLLSLQHSGSFSMAKRSARTVEGSVPEGRTEPARSHSLVDVPLTAEAAFTPATALEGRVRQMEEQQTDMLALLRNLGAPLAPLPAPVDHCPITTEHPSPSDLQLTTHYPPDPSMSPVTPPSKKSSSSIMKKYHLRSTAPPPPPPADGVVELGGGGGRGGGRAGLNSSTSGGSDLE
ncbi:hypothetical protein KSP40_PGU013585 [Platanthera guangdongensis]|uniref:Uncharacterized protein n=1 Tax=Platanthera guangdongensis TaxID=2320717 RepID=A0ABR2MY27_9ASPA